MNRDAVIPYIKKLGATYCQFIQAELLLPEERIRKYCYENKCGCYGKHLMCPPNVGTIPEIKQKFKEYNTGILVQYEKQLDVKKDSAGLTETRLKLHHMVLEIESHLKQICGITKIFGTIGGDCALCEECTGYKGESCRYPEKARPSMEGLGVDVISLLKRLSLDGNFHDDKVTWTAIVLIDE